MGVALQLLGTGLAAWALWKDWREHGGGRPLVPAIARGVAWARRKLGPSPTTITGSGAAVAAVRVAGVGRVVVPVADDAPVEDQLRFLRDRLGFLLDDLDAVRGAVGEVERDLTEKVSEVAAESSKRTAALDERLARVATGSVRLELMGLVLVGVGSVFGALG